jgi:hypothetical protein
MALDYLFELASSSIRLGPGVTREVGFHAFVAVGGGPVH